MSDVETSVAKINEAIELLDEAGLHEEANRLRAGKSNMKGTVENALVNYLLDHGPDFGDWDTEHLHGFAADIAQFLRDNPKLAKQVAPQLPLQIKRAAERPIGQIYNEPPKTNVSGWSQQ